jgi:hypothetical protein
MLTKDCAKKPEGVRLVALLVMGSIGFLMLHSISISVVHGTTAQQRQVQNGRPKNAARLPTAKAPRVNYAGFTHNTHVTQQKLACDSCHKFPTKNWKEVRPGDTAFPDVAEFPEHSACVNCHRQQFFARERPAPAICSNCHVSATPGDTTRFLFPSLGDISNSPRQRRDLVTEFAVSFPHDKHVDVVGLNIPSLQPAHRGFMSVTWQEKSVPPKSAESAGEPKSCPVCHQTFQPQGNSSEEYVTKPPKNLGDAFWLKKGTFKTIPNSHAVCFTCHNTEAGIAPAPSECNACHKLTAPQTRGLQASSPLGVVSDLKTDFDPKLAETIGVTDKSILTTWHRRISAGAFRHEGGEHPNINCMNCHNVPKMNTVDMKTLVVPVRSCGGTEGCHITATADDGGALNYEIAQKKAKPNFVCSKCHISFGAAAVPESHIQAIPTPAPKVK